MTVMLNDEVMSRLTAVAAPEEDITTLAEIAMLQFIERRERQAAGAADMQAMLDGPWHTAAEVNERMRLKYGYSDLSHLSDEELIEDTEQVIARMDPKVRAKMEREGLL